MMIKLYRQFNTTVRPLTEGLRENLGMITIGNRKKKKTGTRFNDKKDLEYFCIFCQLFAVFLYVQVFVKSLQITYAEVRFHYTYI